MKIKDFLYYLFIARIPRSELQSNQIICNENPYRNLAIILKSHIR